MVSLYTTHFHNPVVQCYPGKRSSSFHKNHLHTPAKIPDGIKQDAQFVQVKEVMPLDWT
jgi:hypothetical protein